AVCFAHLRSEHETHARARLSAVVGPSAARGTTWSTWKVASWPSCDSWQYSHRLPARRTTSAWRPREMSLIGMFAVPGDVIASGTPPDRPGPAPRPVPDRSATDLNPDDRAGPASGH